MKKPLKFSFQTTLIYFDTALPFLVIKARLAFNHRVSVAG